jgi:hypothetical protein
MSIIAELDLELLHMNVNAAFLINGKLKEEIFMQQLKVKKLKVKKIRYASLKTIYSLKQSLS